MSSMLPAAIADLDPDHNAHHEALHRRFNEIVSVADFGAVGDGVADDTLAIQDAIDSLPIPTVTTIDGVNYATEGGGAVLVPGAGSVYLISGPISIPAGCQVVGDGATIRASHAGVMFEVDPLAGLYNQNGISVRGLRLDGAGLATIGVDFTRAAYGVLRDLLIHDCTSHGVALRECQYMLLERVNSFSNGAYGFHLSGSLDNGFRSNNNTLVRCEGTKNTAGGIYLEDAHQNEALGCTFQASSAGYGAHLAGSDCLVNVLSGCHFEDNQVHVFLDDTGGRGRGNVIEAPFFEVSPGTERFVINEHGGTKVIAPSSQNDPASMPTTTGTKSQYQQDSTGGHLLLLAPTRFTGSATNLVCDQAGAELDGTYSTTFTIIDEDLFGRFHIWAAKQQYNADLYAAGKVGIGVDVAGSQVFIRPSVAGRTAAIVSGDSGGNADILQVMNFGTSQTRFAIAGDGKIKTNQADAGFTTLGSVVGRQAIHDENGTLVGYVPIYDAITT